MIDSLIQDFKTLNPQLAQVSTKDKIRLLSEIAIFLNRQGLVIGLSHNLLQQSLSTSHILEDVAENDAQINALFDLVSVAYDSDSEQYIDLTKLADYDHYIELISYERTRAQNALIMTDKKRETLPKIKGFFAPELQARLTKQKKEIEHFLLKLKTSISNIESMVDTFRYPHIAVFLAYKGLLSDMPECLKRDYK